MKKKTKQLAISSCTPDASKVGVEIALIGGNAVDAAVAAAFDLMVSNILMASIGGGGYATVRTPDGKIEIFDFFDCMPGKGLSQDYIHKHAKPNKVTVPYGLGVDVLIGHATNGVPGTAKGLDTLLKAHGSLPLSEIVKPAIRNAKNGIKINSTIAGWLKKSAEKIHWYTDYAKKVLSTPEGNIPEPGSLFKQPDLAYTLELIGKYGSDVVYKGEIAEAIINEMKRGGGLITAKDLEEYEVIRRNPLKTNYRDNTVYSNPPPSVGGATLVELLNIISYFDFSNGLTPELNTQLGKAIQFVLNDRFTKYIDTSSNEKVSKELLSSTYANNAYKKITSSSNTTHLSCIDDSGYAVGITMSMGYGSGVGIPGTGIIMDNVLGEMELNPRGYLQDAPGKKLLSSMAPTIMENSDKRQITVLGTPGASRIPSCIAQVIMNLVDFNYDLLSSISLPRMHFEDNQFTIEKGIEVNKSLIDPNSEVIVFNDHDMFFGGAQCVMLENGICKAASDPRRSGAAMVLGE